MFSVARCDKLWKTPEGLSMSRLIAIAALLFTLAASPSANAAGLVWQLPEDGTAATFRGTYKQLVRRSDASQQNVDLSWTRILTVRSVGTEDGEFRGESQPCRWIEFEQTTGEVVGGQVKAGPGGQILVKVLVPEKLVLSGVADEIGIPVSFIPIVKGWKKIDDGAPVPLTFESFDPTPTLTLLGFPRELAAGGTGSTIEVGSLSLPTSQWTGRDMVESTTQRSTSDVEVWRSPEAPFGVAKWSVDVKIETKGSTSDRSEFQESVTTREEMSLQEITDNAESSLQQ